jgi:hypothetical protein
MDAFYAAVVQSVEESVLNALVVNDDMVGRDGHRSPRLPHDRLTALLEIAGNSGSQNGTKSDHGPFTLGETPGGPASTDEENLT